MNRSKRHTSVVTISTLVALATAVACSGDAGNEQARPATAKTSRSQSAAASAQANHAPVVESVKITPAEPTASDTLRAQVAVTDADGDRTQVHYTWWANGQRAGEGSSFVPETVGRGARIEVSVVASDRESQSEPVTASVTLVNSPPQIKAVRFEPSGPWFAGQSVAALPDALDPDADPLSFEYTWYLNGNRLDEDGPSLDGSQFSRGDEIALVVVASDGHTRSDEFEAARIQVANAAPQITSEPGAIGPDGVFRYKLSAADPDGDRAFKYKLLEAPAGAQIDLLEGKLVWRPNESQSGSHAFVLEVDDRRGGRSTQKFTLDVVFGDGPPAPASPR